MSMTEQEIRADEREKIAKDIEGLPGRFAEAQHPDCATVARYIRAETPGGWRAWSGLYEPDADRNLTVEIERRNGDRCINKVRAFDGWLWQAFNQGRDIIRWRLPVAKPQPVPEPKITVKWYDYNWDGHAWRAKPAKVFTPTPKDWRDVPVTAGMLVSVCNLAGPGQVHAAGQMVERVAKQMVAP